MPHTPRLDVHAPGSSTGVVAHNVNAAKPNGRRVPSGHLHNDESKPHTPLPPRPTSQIPRDRSRTPTHASQSHLPSSTSEPSRLSTTTPRHNPKHPNNPARTRSGYTARRTARLAQQQKAGNLNDRGRAGQGRARQHAMARRTYIYIYIYIYIYR
jgi:hypothetical protein